MDEDYKESEISKIVKRLMDEEGFEFGEAVKEAMEQTKKFESKADGGSIGIEVLFKPKRQNLFMGGPALEGPSLSIYDSMKAYGATDQAISDAIKRAGYELPTADSGTTTPPSSGAPDTSNQSGGGFNPYTPNPTETRTKDNYISSPGRQADERSYVGDLYKTKTEANKMMDMYPDYYGVGPKTGIEKIMGMLPGQQLIKAVGSILPTNKRAIVENELLGKGFAIDNVGRFVAATPGSINTAENIMAGYNAYQVDAETFAKRRSLINRKMSDTINPKTGKTFKQEKLDALDAAEAKILGANTTAKNIIDEKDGTTTTPKTLSEKIIEGITAAEDDKGDEMVEDIETIINKDIDTKIPKKKPTTFPDYSGITGVTKPGTPTFPDYSGVTGVTKPGTGIETIKTGQLTKEQYEQMADLISKTNATVYNETTGKYEDIFGNEIKNPNAIDDATLVGTTKTKTKTKSPITGTTKPGTGGRGPVTGTTKPGTKSKGTTTGTTKPGTKSKSKSKSISDRGRGQSNVGTKSKGPVSTKGQAGPPSQRGGGGGGGGGGCFLKGTLITMLDGSTKPVEQVDLGNEVAIGGKVFATGKFLVENLHDYKGIKVSGSHMVNEDNKWVRVEDSKHGKPLGDDEHTVYVFGSENRRILINDILFTDYFETKEQEKLIDDEKDFFNNWKSYDKKIDLDNINTLNAN
jgi:hypothetical protein